MSAKVTSSTARKVIGSLGVVGAAAAVAGMGTFGSFTDSTTAVNTTISSGTVKIDLSKASTLSFDVAGIVPGDSITRVYTMKNVGTTNFGVISMESTPTAASATSPLVTDVFNGLQLSVKSCPVAWTRTGPDSAPVYTCSNPTTLVTGPANVTKDLPATASLAPNGTDNIAITYSLPTDAGNTFQGKSADLSLVFTATQRAAGVR